VTFDQKQREKGSAKRASLQMTDFASSTHLRNWIVASGDEVLHRRYMNGQRVQAGDVAVASSGAALGGRHLVKEERDAVSEDEAVLRHFGYQIRLACGMRHGAAVTTATWRVSATAITFLQRFYLHNSLLVHDPRLVMMACILLAGKVEESNVSMRELLKLNPKSALEDVLDVELKLMHGVGYNLKVFHPQNLLATITADVKRSLAADPKMAARVAEHSEKSKSWLPEAERIVELLQLTPVVLCFAPLDVAAAALLLAQPSELPLPLETYLTRRFGVSASTRISASCAGILEMLPDATACAEGRELERAAARLKAIKASPLCRWGRGRGAQPDAKRRRTDDVGAETKMDVS